jgi:fructose-bisphosphate aldolase class I
MEQAQMNSQMLKDTAKSLFANDKGLLAMDENNGTCNNRFEKPGIPQTVETRKANRELIVTTPGLGKSIDLVSPFLDDVNMSPSQTASLAEAGSATAAVNFGHQSRHGCVTLAHE